MVFEPFLGEIKIISWNFPPKGWAFCSGQLLPINQNQALFSILGTTYGGDGRVNFALPDLRARAPMHRGEGHTEGERGGEVAHTLSVTELPAHTHVPRASTTAGNTPVPVNTVLAPITGANVYTDSTASLAAMSAATVNSVGGGQAHENRQPFLALNFVIALQGIFPSQN
jgi:microcystin-dependent protein